MMQWTLNVNSDYMDTSIGEYDKTSVEILKLRDGTLKFSGSKGSKAKIIKEEYCDIKVSTGVVFCNVPTNWLIEHKSINN